MYHWYDFVGNVGVVSILIAYFLLQLNKNSHTELIFSLMNFFGALLILISLYFEFNLSAFLIEFFWLLISAIGIGKFLANRSTSPQQ